MSQAELSQVCVMVMCQLYKECGLKLAVSYCKFDKNVV